MRVVFLDFDGVLNTETGDVDDSAEFWAAAWLDPTLVARLGSIVEQSSAKVVVSSSWRQRRTIEELAAILDERGFSYGVHDVTPRLPRPPEGEHLVRAHEIASWLSAHPEVVTFVILDDERDLGSLADRHVWVDPTRGLSEADALRARMLLGAESRTR